LVTSRIGAGEASVGGRPFAAYFEAHIEQGPILEDTGNTIGVVTGALGLRWYDVVANGQDAHAGPTPMLLRRDALLGAAQIVQEVNRIAFQHQPEGRATVGFMQVKPNSRNVVPGEVRMTVDLRNAKDATLSAMKMLRDACGRVGARIRSRVRCTARVTSYPTSSFPIGVGSAGSDERTRLQAHRHRGAGHTRATSIDRAHRDDLRAVRRRDLAQRVENAKPRIWRPGATLLRAVGLSIE
jgi:N-carbamoyl-L-amino-acid hydrolase